VKISRHPRYFTYLGLLLLTISVERFCGEEFALVADADIKDSGRLRVTSVRMDVSGAEHPSAHSHTGKSPLPHHQNFFHLLELQSRVRTPVKHDNYCNEITVILQTT